VPELASLTMLGILYGATVCSLSCLPTLGPLLVGEGGSFRQGIQGALSFMSGKVIAYTVLGGIAAGIGRQVPLEHPLTRIIPGIILVLTAAYLVFSRPGSCNKGSCRPTRRKFSFLALGAATGITPCAPLLSVMLLAAQQDNLLAGAACGFFFGAPDPVPHDSGRRRLGVPEPQNSPGNGGLESLDTTTGRSDPSGQWPGIFLLVAGLNPGGICSASSARSADACPAFGQQY